MATLCRYTHCRRPCSDSMSPVSSRLPASAQTAAWNRVLSAARSAIRRVVCAVVSNLVSTAESSGPSRCAASLAASSSSDIRTSNRSSTSCTDICATTAPRRGWARRKPSASRTRMASRTGLRETPKSSASRSSVSRWPGS